MNLSLGMVACSRSRLGISLTQGAHQVAHRLISRAWPVKSASRSGLSLASRNSRSGIGLGGRAGLKRAMAPLIRLLDTSARAVAGKATMAMAVLRTSRRLGRKTRSGCAISRVPKGSMAYIHGTEEHDCASSEEPLQHDVGRPLQARAGGNHGEDQRLHRFRSPALRAGHRGLAGP